MKKAAFTSGFHNLNVSTSSSITFYFIANQPLNMPKKTNEREYQAIKKTLIDSGVVTAEQIQDKIQGMFQSARRYSLVGAIIMLAMSLVFPKYRIFIILIYALYMAWIWSSTLSSKHYFKRFLDEINA